MDAEKVKPSMFLPVGARKCIHVNHKMLLILVSLSSDILMQVPFSNVCRLYEKLSEEDQAAAAYTEYINEMAYKEVIREFVPCFPIIIAH